MKAVVCASVAAVLAMPAVAQTAKEAAAMNMQLAIDLCIRNGRDGAGTLEALRQAGFRYQAEDFGGGPGDVLHWFHAPGETMNVAVVVEPGAVRCRVGTAQMGVAEAVALGGAVLENLHPGVFTYGSMEGTAPVTPPSNDFCTGYVGWFGQRPVTVGVATLGNDPTCTEDGTAQIMVEM